MKCSNCSFKNNTNARFCQECGRSLIATTPSGITEPIVIKFNVAAFDEPVDSLYNQQKAYLGNLSDIAWIKDIHGIYIYANEAYAKAANFEQDKMPGKTDYDFWPKEIAQKYQEDDNLVIQSKQVIIVEEPFHDKDTLVESIKSPFFNAKGEVIATIGVARDITHRGRLNQQLYDKNMQLTDYICRFKVAETRLQLTQKSVDMCMIPTFWINSNAKILQINQVACDVLGYTKEEFLKMTIFDIDRWYKEDSWPMMWKTLQEQKCHVFESLHKRKDGTTFFVEITANFVVFDDQEYIFAYARDISERKEFEKELIYHNNELEETLEKLKKTESELRLTQLAIDLSSVGAFWVDKDANIIRVNKAACDSVGYTYEELASMKVFDFDPNFTNENWKNNWEVWKNEKIAIFESIQKNKDGSTHPTEIHLNFFEFEGQEYIFTNVTDISKRKCYEREILAKNKELSVTQKSIELFSAIFIATNKEGKILKANQYACDLLGYTKDEMSLIPIWDLFANINEEQWYEYWEMRKTQPVYEYEADLLRKDGTVFPCEVVSNLLTMDGQEFTFAYGKDITERKQYEKEILERNNELQIALDKIKQTESELLLTQKSVDIASISTFWVGENAEIIRVNQATADTLGYTQDELCQMFIYDIDPVHSKEVWPHKWKAFKDNQRMTFETIQKRKDGTTFPVEIASNYFIFEGKDYVLAYGKDITDRKQYENDILERNERLKAKEEELRFQNEELQAKEEELRSQNEELLELYERLQLKERELANEKAFLLGALSQSSAGIIIADAPDAKIKFVNNAALGIRGDTNVQLTNIPYEKHQENWQLHRPDRTIFESEELPLTQAIMHGKVSRSVEAIMCNENGEYRDISINAAPIYNIDGEITAAIGVFQDVTDKKMLERQLKDEHQQLEIVVKDRTLELNYSLDQLKETNLSLEQAHQHKNRFISSMSHELRTPLNAIIGFTQTLEKKYFGDLNEKQMEYIALVRSSGEHLLSLITDILNIANIDSGSMKFIPEYIDFHQFINEIVSIMSSQFKDKNISLETSIDENITLIYADELKCKQILFNLLSNALKFTTEECKVTIEALNEGDFIKVIVSDEGIGIKEQDLDKVFIEFYQSDVVRDQALGGAGIGLALTRRLVEMHGGTIGVESELDKGSKFWFKLPVNPQH